MQLLLHPQTHPQGGGCLPVLLFLQAEAFHHHDIYFELSGPTAAHQEETHPARQTVPLYIHRPGLETRRDQACMGLNTPLNVSMKKKGGSAKVSSPVNHNDSLLARRVIECGHAKDVSLLTILKTSTTARNADLEWARFTHGFLALKGLHNPGLFSPRWSRHGNIPVQLLSFLCE